jgi:transcriptional regulator with XRE-family HTH domain
MERMKAEERERRGWSQSFVTRLTGIAQSDLSAFENGRRAAGPGQRRRLARALGLTESELFVPIEQGADRG